MAAGISSYDPELDMFGFCFWLMAVLLYWMQLLQQETEASEVEWDKLGQNILSLRDTISPAAAAIISKCLDRQRDR